MCAVSAVHDKYFPPGTSPYLYSIDTLKEYLELVRKAQEYDRITKQPDCIKPEFEGVKEIVEKMLKESDKIS